jgi:4-amino-4-deoxy-L-arabinose transferase-like glycosyltransferase
LSPARCEWWSSPRFRAYQPGFGSVGAFNGREREPEQRAYAAALMRPFWQPAIGPMSVALLAIALLAPFINVDPARGVTFSNAPFSDEGWNLVGARNIALFGHPSTDEWRTWLLAVPFAIVEAAAFALFGTSLLVARAAIIVAVALTGAAIVAALQGPVGRANAWLAGAAFVACGLVLYYGRLAFLEPLVGLFLAGGVLTLVPAPRRRPLVWGAVGGVLLALAVMTKSLAAPSVLGIIVVAAVTAVRQGWARRWLAAAAVSGGAVAAAWVVVVLLPNARAVGRILEEVYPPYRLPVDLEELLTHLASLPLADGAVIYAGPLLVLAAIGGARLVTTTIRGGVQPGDVAPLATLAALLAAIATLGIVDYQPNRYVVAFLPLAAILAGWIPPLPALRGGAERRPRPAVVALVALFAVVPGMVLHASWVRGGGREVASIQAAALGSLPPGASIAGQYAPLVALGAPGVRTIVPFETVNGDDLYLKGVRYLIWIDEGPGWMAAHPQAWLGRRVLGCMTWGKVPERSCIYELPDSP